MFEQITPPQKLPVDAKYLEQSKISLHFIIYLDDVKCNEPTAYVPRSHLIKSYQIKKKIVNQNLFLENEVVTAFSGLWHELTKKTNFKQIIRLIKFKMVYFTKLCCTLFDAKKMAKSLNDKEKEFLDFLILTFIPTKIDEKDRKIYF